MKNTNRKERCIGDVKENSATFNEVNVYRKATKLFFSYAILLRLARINGEKWTLARLNGSFVSVHTNAEKCVGNYNRNSRFRIWCRGFTIFRVILSRDLSYEIKLIYRALREKCCTQLCTKSFLMPLDCFHILCSLFTPSLLSNVGNWQGTFDILKNYLQFVLSV